MYNNQDDIYKQPYDQYQQYNSMPAQPNGISLAAMICGIAGFASGYGVSIAALILANIYKNKHNGQHCKQSSIGFKCGLASLIIWGVMTMVYIAYCIFVFTVSGSLSFLALLDVFSNQY